MSRALGNHAVVVGAGIGGLAAAAALSPYFGKVTVLDKDSLPTAGEARMGVGQGAHTHQLLKGGENALESLLPGFRDDLYAAGAAEIRVGVDVTVIDPGGLLPQCEPGFSVTALSRPVYEQTLRGRVRALGNVELRDETPVERILVESGRCVGLALADGQSIGADLVVDSSGMNGPLASQLATDGHAEFETEAVKINVAYTTQRFKQPDAWRGERHGFFLMPGQPNPRFGLMLPIEDDQWIVSLGARGPTSVSRDIEAFRAYAAGLGHPGVIERIGQATPVGEAKTFRKTFATRRKFGAAARWPDRLLAIGDAMTSFNPTFGQGMSVAACQAAALAKVLAERATAGDALDGLGAAYFPPAEAIAGAAWTMAINVDYGYPETEGERPTDFAKTQLQARVFRQLVGSDPELLVLRTRMGHLLESGAALRQSPFAERIAAAMQVAPSP